MNDTILVLNAGSSSFKFQLFDIDSGTPVRTLRGQIEGVGTTPRLKATDSEGSPVVDKSFERAVVTDMSDAMVILRDWLREHLAGQLPIAVGHRVVHGGPNFNQPVLVDDEIIAELDSLIPLAPLHQPSNLAPIKAIREVLPNTPQVACFGTAFHRRHGELADHYAIPTRFHEEGIRRYGFHGLSYEYIAKILPDIAPKAAVGLTIVGHLGNGASLCAMQGGRSVDSTMGFTALDGLPMGTRPGQIDPGVILYLIANKQMSPQEVEHMLYHESGLKGLSGVSNDFRDLLASDNPRARMALDFFAYRTAKEVGALVTVLGGLDALIFTAGIGENEPRVRKDICDWLTWLGVALDDKANARNATQISRHESYPLVYVIPTDEEWMIVTHTLEVIRQF
jgi:acetate kinase